MTEDQTDDSPTGDNSDGATASVEASNKAFEAILSERLDQLAANKAKLKGEMVRIQQALDEVGDQASHITALLRQIGGAPKRQRRGAAQIWVEAAVELLKAEGPLHYKEIYSRLRERGDVPLPGGKTPETTLSNRLATDERVIRTDRGVYGVNAD